ncbi:MAG: bifunctional folylpolyglutamate synthase/dihydrofolate synthase [Aureispira sp.]|nr:bifunctional folylpolyglutamate synthase/dihydrofolate synthase [Aureispira sp.]
MNYQDTISYMYQQLPMFQRIGATAMKHKLDNIRELCQYLGSPQDQFKSVHIAGTNGKGSTTHILASMLQEAGYKVGMYTSPHYKDFRERIKINGTYISETAVVEFVAKNKTLFENLQPSFFEITVALAFQYFATQKVDIAIIETGLGGRLDSTNIITPLLSIITNIGYDHQDLLGDTLPEIATEKAGIIKANIPVIIGEYHSETFPVFEDRAKMLNAPLQLVSEHLNIELIEHTENNAIYHVSDQHGESVYPNLKLDLLGKYQIHNLGNALLAAKKLNEENFTITKENIYTACANVTKLSRMLGRWQVLQQKPFVVCDSAHNKHGLQYVLPALEARNARQLHVVLGVVKDKKVDEILPLFPKSAKYYFCKANIPRGLNAEILREKAALFELTGTAYKSVQDAYQGALGDAHTEDCIFVGGSIFVVAEVI